MKAETDLLIDLYHQKSKLIHNYLLKMGASPEDAEDITQETFVKAVEYLPGLKQDHLSAWLFKVALNKYYDHCRKQKKYPQAVIDEARFVELFVQEEDAHAHLILGERTSEIQRVFNMLSLTNKNLLLLKYDMALSYEKIAELLEINPQNVKTYLYRARNDFRKKWEENQNEQHD